MSVSQVINIGMSGIIVILGIAIAVVNVMILRLAKQRNWRVIYSGISLYWAAIYLYAGINAANTAVGQPGSFGAVWVRPGLVFTLGFMFSQSLARYKIVRRNGETIRNDT